MTDHVPAPKGSPRHAFGETLKRLREQAGMTREELAVKAQQSESLIRSYEDAWRVPVRVTVAEIVERVPELDPGGVLLVLWDEFEESMSYQVFRRRSRTGSRRSSRTPAACATSSPT